MLPRTQQYSQRFHLLPFALLAMLGVWGLAGWWTGQAEWVQLGTYQLPFAANTALIFLLIGSATVVGGLARPRIGQALALAAGLVGGLCVADGISSEPLGITNLLTDHQALIHGARVGRVSLALAVLLTSIAALLAWSLGNGVQRRRPILLALMGSAASGYGFAGLVGGRVGLERVDAWVTYAAISPFAAIGLILLGAGLFLFAARHGTAGNENGPRWLWLPVVTAGFTITALFYVSLREREVSYVNATTQLTLNTLATAFTAETEGQANDLMLLASHWSEAPVDQRGAWDLDASALARTFPAYRSISRVDASHRTRWIWPEKGNEESLAFDHARDPLRRQAIRAVRDTLRYSVASPILTPGRPASFVVYAPVIRTGGAFDGVVAGEIAYAELFQLLASRLNLPPRYWLDAAVLVNDSGETHETLVYASDVSAASVPGRYYQSATFNLAGQRLRLQLTPRPGTIAPSRHFLPELALCSGLGVSLLLGMVVNLAQAAQRRQRRAEETSEKLREENEERRRVEGRLKTSDERLNLALDSTLVGVFEWDVPSGVTLYSPSVWSSVGYDPTSMPSTAAAWLSLMHPDDAPEYQREVDAHFRGETPFIEMDYRIRRASGEYDWLTARAKCVTRDAAGGPVRVIGTCQNITLRKQSEEALRESRAATRMLSHVARRTDNIVIITSASGNIEWVNDSFTRLTGYPLSEVNGALFLDLLGSPDTDPRSLERVTAALVAGEPVTTEVMATSHTENRRYHLRLELQPVKSENGTLEHFIAMAADITSRVETEVELRRAKGEADAASRAKSEFLASMSHEIRTPMNGVIGMTSLLLDTELTAEQKDFVNTIRTSGDALLAIINEILDFSKIESGRMEIESHPFAVAHCVEEALDMFALAAAAKNIELAYLVEPGVPAWISGDITRLRQVLVNLINNAVKFTPQGSITVVVKCHTYEQADGSRAPYRQGDSLMIDFLVSDTGIGIPDDRLHLLFKPFSQVDSSTTRKYGGTGLGLAICDRLCHLMGGHIDVTTKVGHGSTFRFSILAPPVPTPEDIPAPQLPPSVTGTRMLVVDDLRLNRELLGHALAAYGVTVVGAAMVHDAVELMMQQRFGAAIIDLDLTGESGMPLAEQLRREHPKMPVILLTNPVENVRRSGSQDPYLARIPKPVKPSLVIETLNRQFKFDQIAATQAESPAMPKVPLLAAQIPLQILLVEDNPVNQKVAQRYLERLGYHADAAANGMEGVSSALRKRYDLILMDIQMPEMDGYAATREIRSHLPRRDQPRIVALTANAVQGDRERCLQAGMDDYLAKPVKIDALESVILKHFGA